MVAERRSSARTFTIGFVGVQISLPPLRERIEDLVPMLAEYFLGRIAEERDASRQRLAESARKLLCRHRWPGNIRELENVLRSVSLFAEGTELTEADFADYPELRHAVVAPAAPQADLGEGAYAEMRAGGYSLRELKKKLECECIQRALTDAGGNITRAAELLGMKRPRLSQLIKEHGISVER